MSKPNQSDTPTPRSKISDVTSLEQELTSAKQEIAQLKHSQTVIDAIYKDDWKKLQLELLKARQEIERLKQINMLWRSTFQKYQSWQANGCTKADIEEVTSDYRLCSQFKL